MVPGCVTLLLRKTHQSLVASTLQEFEKSVAVNELASEEVKWFGGSGARPAAYMYRNGSLVIPGGLDRPSKFLSMSVDRIYIDEATEVTATAVEVLMTRLRGSAATYKQLLMMTNPAAPSHHLYEMAREGRAEMLFSKHTENPYLFNRDGTPTAIGETYMERLKSLSGVRRARYLEGLWVAAEGQVFDAWRDDIHVIDPFEIPSDWRTVWVWDQGFQNPQVFQRWAVDGDGRAYLTHEMSVRQRLVEDFARDILELKEQYGWKWPEVFVADHDGGGRATMERHLGYTTHKAKKAVSPGLQAVANRLAVQKDGKARLYVFRDALVGQDPMAASDKRPRGLVAEVGGYVWQTIPGTDGVPKEEPVKQHDHSMDCMRYLCAYLDLTPPAKAGNPARASQGQPRPGSPWGQLVGR